MFTAGAESPLDGGFAHGVRNARPDTPATQRGGQWAADTPLRESPLPDTGALESDLVQAFTRRFTVGLKTEGRAWARLLEERYRPEVEAIIGAAVAERRHEWRSMVTRGIDRGELPLRTDVQ